MPRANNPIDAVLNYFKHASIDAAETALHVAKGILKERRAAGTPQETLVRKAPPAKKRAARPTKVQPDVSVHDTTAYVPSNVAASDR